ncbi:MAG: hypothetical protein GY716_23335 [bacterium]|nr:hypothetical protein [bacterium]
MILTLALPAVPTAAQSLNTPLLTDPGLNSNSQPLLPFLQNTLDRWMQENAALVIGVQADGVMPDEGDGMLAIYQTVFVSSQVRQRIDVSALSTAIDSGTVAAFAMGRVNASFDGAVGGVAVTAYDASEVALAVLAPTYTFDGDNATWQPAASVLMLPVGTRYVEHEFQFSNANLPPIETAYGDRAGLMLSHRVLAALVHLNAQTMLEATASGYRMIQADLGLDAASTCTWSGTFDESGWSSSISGVIHGQPFTLDYSGSSEELPSDEFEVSFAAEGFRGVAPITIEGTATYQKDPVTNLYVSMQYDDQGSLGDDGGPVPRFNWLRSAAEGLAGGIVGGVVGGLIGGFMGAGQGAVLGIATGILLSEAAFHSARGMEPDPPTPPDIPDILGWAETDRTISANQLLTIVGGDGSMTANLENVVYLEGTWAEGTATGTGFTDAPTSGGSIDSLRVAKGNGSEIDLSWLPSCASSDDDFSVYEGSLGSLPTYDHGAVVCSTGGAIDISVAPAADSSYYLVTPGDTMIEGSYGRDGSGAERPQGAGACAVQVPTACP